MRRHLLAVGASLLVLGLGGVGTAVATEPSVDQTNAAPAAAAASNANTADQSIDQGGGGAPSQSASQSATDTQTAPVATAPATSAQVVPVNVNAPVRILSKGDAGDVKQTNAAPAAAVASNANGAEQSIDQGGGGATKTWSKGDGGSDPAGQSAGQSATNTQTAPVAIAPATSAQVLPINLNLPLSVGDGLHLPRLPVVDGPVKTSPTAVLEGPVGSATGLLGTLPLGGLPLVGALPLQPVLNTVGSAIGTVTGLVGGLPLPLSSLPVAI
jgi:hypothetical protein